MDIGVVKETKLQERRVALVPNEVSKLVGEGHQVYVEDNAGLGAGFNNQNYRDVGAQIVPAEEVYEKKLLIRVKEPPIESLREQQILMGYLHIEKGQSPELKQALLEKRVTAYAFEEIRDLNTTHRLVSLGFEAGVVGMFEGLRTYGQIQQQNGKNNPFKSLKPIREYASKDDAYLALRDINPRDISTRVYIAGYGKVSKGAQEVLSKISCPPTILKEEDTARIPILGREHAYIWKHLPQADIFVNAIVWQPGSQRVITKKDLERMVDGSLIVDISCDENGGVESCIPTTWKNPSYRVITENGNNIFHYCVDNMPSAIAHDSSVNLSKMIYPHVLKVANGETLPTGLMTKNGEYKFN
jgi:alanine dehydrogenase